MQKQYFILLAVLEPWVENCSQKFFVAVVSAEIDVINCMRSSTSACIALRWIMGVVIRDVTRGSVSICTVTPPSTTEISLQYSTQGSRTANKIKYCFCMSPPFKVSSNTLDTPDISLGSQL